MNKIYLIFFVMLFFSGCNNGDINHDVFFEFVDEDGINISSVEPDSKLDIYLGDNMEEFLIEDLDDVYIIDSVKSSKEIEELIQNSDYDKFLFKEGEYVFDYAIDISRNVQLFGEGVNRTIFRRTQENEFTSPFFQIVCDNSDDFSLVLSGFSFYGFDSIVANEGGVKIINCRDFYIYNNSFENFGGYGVYVDVDDEKSFDDVSFGKIFGNYFVNNYKIDKSESRGYTLGYGIRVDGDDNVWKCLKGFSNEKCVGEISFGDNFSVIVENNYFENNRHAIAAGGGARYIFRNNEVVNHLISQAIDAHGGGAYTNNIGTRTYEIYSNNIYNTLNINGDLISSEVGCDLLSKKAIMIRGGDGLIYNNNISGFVTGIELWVEKAAFSESELSSKTSYPLRNQVRNLWIWDNFVFDEGLCEAKVMLNKYPLFMKENRDYFLNKFE